MGRDCGLNVRWVTDLADATEQEASTELISD